MMKLARPEIAQELEVNQAKLPRRLKGIKIEDSVFALVGQRGDGVRGIVEVRRLGALLRGLS